MTKLRSRDIYGKTVIEIRPKDDNMVEFDVVETDKIRANMYVNELRAFAEESGKSWQRLGNLIKINFGNTLEAEAACRVWYG